MNLTVIVLYLLSFLLLWQFVVYPSLMAVIALKAKPGYKDFSFLPSVSIIVPAYNEEKVIENRITNLLDLDYPRDKYEIIIVESGSTDNTYNIAESVTENYNSEPVMKLVKEIERKGKASAINFGKKYAKGAIILVTDANSIFDKNVLKEMMPHFQDPEVGAVGGRYVVSNPEKPLAASESFYWDLEYMQRKGESVLDSACLFHGEINAWRKELVDADPEMLSEDLDIAVQIRKKGYKIKYEPEAIVYEPSASTVRDQIVQRKRTSIGTIQTIFKHRSYLLAPHDIYSLIIFPSHKTLVMLSPFLLLAIPVLYTATDITIVITHFVLTMVLFMGLFALLIFLKSRLIKKEGLRSVFSISSIPKIVYYVLLNEYLILLAWKDFVSKRYSILWEKAESSREV